MTKLLAGIAVGALALVLGLDAGDRADARGSGSGVAAAAGSAVNALPDPGPAAPPIEAEARFQAALSEAYRAEAAHLQPFVHRSAAAEAAARILVLKMDGLRVDAAALGATGAPTAPPLALGPVAATAQTNSRRRLMAALALNRRLGFDDMAVIRLADAQAAFDCHALVAGMPALESAAGACAARFDAAMADLGAHLAMHAAVLAGTPLDATRDGGDVAAGPAPPRLEPAVYRVRPVPAPETRGA